MIRTVLAAAAALAMLAAPAIAGETFDLGGSAKGVPSTVAYEFQGEEAFAVFVRGSDGLLYAKVATDQGNQWTDWAPIGTLVLKGDPSCTARSVSRIDCAAVGPDNAVNWTSYDAKANKWTGWTSVGGFATSDPSAVTTREGGKPTLRIFVRGPQNHLFMNSLIGGKWTDWKDLQGVVDGEISCARVFKLGAHCYDSSGKGVLQLMDVTHKTGKDVVTQNLGGAVSGKVSAVGTDDFIHVFVLGPQNHLWFNAWNKKWSGWSDTDMTIVSAPGCDLDQTETEAWCATVNGDGTVTMTVLLDGEI